MIEKPNLVSILIFTYVTLSLEIFTLDKPAKSFYFKHNYLMSLPLPPIDINPSRKDYNNLDKAITIALKLL